MTNWSARTIPTVSWSDRPAITTFTLYTWANAPDTWALALGNWDSYGVTTTGTIWTTNR